jgi:hypothetical protein
VNAPLIRLGQGCFVCDVAPEDLVVDRRDRDHGPVEERRSHAEHSAALMIETANELAGELHPDHVAQFWARINEHAKRRFEAWQAKRKATSR